MSRINLKRLISKKDLSSIIRACVALSDVPITLWDASSNLLLGRKQKGDIQRYPVHGNGEVIGWVDGDDKASLLASMISFAARTEYEKKALSRETLNKYQKLIHLHDMTEQIALSLEFEEVTRVAVDQAVQSITATGASIMLYSEKDKLLHIAAAYGEESHPKTIMKDGTGIAGAVMKTGKAEIINDVYSDPRYIKGSNEVHSLMCTPLLSKGKSIGVFNVSSHEPYNYLAEDLKLLMSIASQTATAITNAQLFQQTRTYAEELENKNVQLQTEISQREQSENALKASEEKYRLHFENVLDVIYSVDADLKIVTMSPSVEKIIGYTPNELIGRVFTDLNILTEDSLQRAIADTMRIMGGERIESAEYEFIAKDGSIKIGEVSSAPLVDNGRIVSIFSVARDITERIQAEKALLATSQFLDNIIESSQDCIIVGDSGGILTRVNRYFLDLLGYEEADVLGKHMSVFTATEKGTFDLISGESVKIDQEYLDKQLRMVALLRAEKKVVNWEAYLIHKNGKFIPVEVNINYLFDEHGERTGSVGVVRDITERKKAEKEIVETRDFLGNIIENSQDFIIISDPRGYIMRGNKNFLQSLGYDMEELRGKHMVSCAPTTNGSYELISGKVVEITQEFHDSQVAMIDALQKEGKVSNWISFYSRSDGKLIPVEQSIFYLYSERGEIIGSVGIVRDITERKKTEDKLIEATAFLDNIIESSQDCIVTSDTKGYFTQVNKSFLELLGYKKEEVLGRHSAEFAPPEEGVYESTTGLKVEITEEVYKDQLAMMATLLENGKISNWEAYYCRKDRTLVPIEQNIVYLYDKKGRKTGTVAVLRDITERRKAEREITETRDFLDNIIESSLDCVVVSDRKGYLTRVNNYFLELTGYQKEEVLGKHISEFAPADIGTHELVSGGLVMITQDFFDNQLAMMAALREKEKVSNWNAYYCRKDKKLISVEQNIMYLYNKGGEKTGSVGISRDITERKKAEKEITEARDFLQDVIKTSLDGIIVTDALSTITMINQAAVNILGYSREELVNRQIKGFLEVGGEVEERGKQIQKILMEKGAVYGYEHAWKKKDGTYVDLEMSVALLQDQDKGLTGAVLSIRDITERKQAERKILEYQDQLRSLASQLTLTEEQERRGIATELHDRIGQTLAISKIKLGALRAATTSLGLDKDVDDIRDLIEQSIQDTRSLIFDLCPPFLYELGFEKALEWLLEDIQEQYGIATQLECDGEPFPLDDDLRILLYQSVRELFVNIVKHSEAQHARLSVQRGTTTLNVCVEDDGRGFDEPTRVFQYDKKGGFGLFRIKERFHYLGGNITIDSKPQQGTRISLVLPFKSSEHPNKEDVQ